MRIIVLLICLISFLPLGISQKGNSAFGIQYKPIIPNRYIGEYEQSFDSLPLYHATSKQSFGNSLGMIVRYYFTDKVALETGINFTKRTFNLTYEVADSGFIATNKVGLINYQTPVKGLFFIQLSDEIYMNASMGLNFDFFPTKVGTYNVVNINNQFGLIGYKTSWVQLGANANFGFEYRTRKKGTFYLGATYNQPFKDIMIFNMYWNYSSVQTNVLRNINGSFLTLDLRYYLPIDKSPSPTK
jgi:hypothetical protein